MKKSPKTKNKYYLDKLFTNLVALRGILPLSAAFSGNESVVNAARALGIDTSNKDETVLRREISDKLKTS